MAPSLGEIPEPTFRHIGDLHPALRAGEGDAGAALDHVGPFRGEGMPVQLPDGTGLEGHVHPGEPLAHREVVGAHLLGGAAVVAGEGLAVEGKAEGGQGAGARHARPGGLEHRGEHQGGEQGQGGQNPAWRFQGGIPFPEPDEGTAGR